MVTDLHREFDAIYWLANGTGGGRPEFLPETYSSAGWRIYSRAIIPLAEETAW